MTVDQRLLQLDMLPVPAQSLATELLGLGLRRQQIQVIKDNTPAELKTPDFYKPLDQERDSLQAAIDAKVFEEAKIVKRNLQYNTSENKYDELNTFLLSIILANNYGRSVAMNALTNSEFRMVSRNPREIPHSESRNIITFVTHNPYNPLETVTLRSNLRFLAKAYKNLTGEKIDSFTMYQMLHAKRSNPEDEEINHYHKRLIFELKKIDNILRKPLSTQEEGNLKGIRVMLIGQLLDDRREQKNNVTKQTIFVGEYLYVRDRRVLRSKLKLRYTDPITNDSFSCEIPELHDSSYSAEQRKRLFPKLTEFPPDFIISTKE